VSVPTPASSLAHLVKPVAADAHVTAAAWLGDKAAFALGDGCVLLVDGEATKRLAVHPDGAVLAAAGDGSRLLTGGDDGRVCTIAADGTITTLADAKGKWIDALAVSPRRAVAFSAGRTVTVIDGDGRVRTLNAPSSVRGLAFAPKGFRLALSHQNGATLWFPNTDAAPEMLFWKGSHLDVTWSPDGRFVATSMQENMLHVWRHADGKDMRMSGYPGKTRSFSWSPNGLQLATSGASAAIVWPFDGKDGPMGRPPTECGFREARATRVAFHPSADVLAVGYDNGNIAMVRLKDAHELEVRGASPGGAVTALAWDAKGARLAFGCEEGAAGTVTLPTG
jgi:WD40 repeat protein